MLQLRVSNIASSVSVGQILLFLARKYTLKEAMIQVDLTKKALDRTTIEPQEALQRMEAESTLLNRDTQKNFRARMLLGSCIFTFTSTNICKVVHRTRAAVVLMPSWSWF
jgi:hypothetical protein